jgi:hypothetical protein
MDAEIDFSLLNTNEISSPEIEAEILRKDDASEKTLTTDIKTHDVEAT